MTTAATPAATDTPLMPLWSVTRSTHKTYNCDACEDIAQAAAGRLAAGAVSVTLAEERADGKHRATVARVGREPVVHADSPLQPEDLTAAERTRLVLARPEAVVALEQMADGYFNVHGNHVVVCPECGCAFIGEHGVVTTIKQRHLSVDHGLSYPLLP